VDVAEFAEKAANSGKIVIMSSLYGTYDKQEWPNISKLVPLCEKIKRLSAICKICGYKAIYTFRHVQDKVENAACATSNLIGGAEQYMPLCRECHNEKTQQQKNSKILHSEKSNASTNLNESPMSQSEHLLDMDHLRMDK
jgi:thymidine kinase